MRSRPGRMKMAASRRQPATQSARGRSEAPQSTRLSKAVRQDEELSWVIGSPWPGISVVNGVAAMASSARRQPSGQAVSMNGTSVTTRSPETSSRSAGS